MITLQEIDRRIEETLLLLQRHQDEAEGFATSVTQPQPVAPDVWIKEMQNAFVPANVLLPLTLLKSAMARQLLEKEYNLLQRNRNSSGLWHYFNNTKAPYFIPYETDTNSLLSFVSERLSKKPLAKKHFYEQLSENGYFNLWFLPKWQILFSNPLYYLAIKKNLNKAQNYLAFKNKVVNITDAEFSVSANVLLYTGDNEFTKGVVNKLLADINLAAPIGLIYYPNQVIACYLFSRAAFYGHISAFNSAKERLLKRLITAYRQETNDKDRHLTILAATSFLFFNSTDDSGDELIGKSWNLYTDIETPFPFYCSNLRTDINITTGLPNAYFGSTPLTISFYLEFLNLLRFRRFGNYYSEPST